MLVDAKIPAGPLTEKWDNYKDSARLVNPANKRKYTVLVVGTGLAGGSAAATLAELGYNVKAFCIQEERGVEIPPEEVEHFKRFMEELFPDPGRFERRIEANAAEPDPG